MSFWRIQYTVILFIAACNVNSQMFCICFRESCSKRYFTITKVYNVVFIYIYARVCLIFYSSCGHKNELILLTRVAAVYCILSRPS